MTGATVRAPVLVAAGAALCLLWPLSAYAYGPAALPAVGLALSAGVVVALRPEMGIAIALALIPFRRVAIALPEGGSVQPLKFGLPLLALALLAYGLIAVRERRSRRPALVIAGVAFMAVAVASALQGVGPSRSLGELTQLGTAVVLFLAAVHICSERKHLMIVAAGAVAGLLGAALLGLGQQASGSFSDVALAIEGEEVGRVAGLFGHPNQYAGYLAALIPLATALAWSSRSPAWLRCGSGLAAAAALPALTFAYTRGAIAGLVAGAALWLGVTRPRAVIPLIAVLAVAFVVAAPSVLKERIQDVRGAEVALRTDLWGAAVDIYGRRPLLGVGMDNFSTAYAALPASVTYASQRRLLHGQEVLVPPHANSLYMTVLAELGMLGLVALLALGLAMLGAARRAFLSDERGSRAVASGLGAGVLVMAIHGLVEVTLLEVMPVLLVLAGALAATIRVGPASGLSSP